MELAIKNVSKTYGDLLVLNKINLNVNEGQIVCIIGPSGCGKSTLLRLIGGLEHPDNGSIEARGTPPPDCLNPLTYIFQDFSLLPWRHYLIEYLAVYYYYFFSHQIGLDHYFLNFFL